ncbi:hypothetical protein B0H19DRAFT_1192903 [Mycena capillaripes]|nr:hypothetical protein B0H19DRAFT_1192903 [Mycena capillaripes]
MTIRARLSYSPSDLSDSERPKRRRKLEHTLDCSKDSESKTTNRHAEYFREDGDCYLQAEDVIFKIHRYHLLRGGDSIFKDIFLLPQGANETDPIVLSGNSAEQFSGFLSIAYAELLDFQIEHMCQHRVPSLIDCAFFAHKYNITPLLLASLRAVVYIAKNALPFESDIAASVMELQSLCDIDEDSDYSTSGAEIEYVVEWGWITGLDANCTFEDLADAMDFGEDHDLSQLLAHGAAFYAEKISADARNTSPGCLTFPSEGHDFLRSSHRARILSGAQSLEQLWTTLTSRIPPFPKEAGCDRDYYSLIIQRARWEKDWRNALSSNVVQKITCVDMAKKLLTFEKTLQPAFETGLSKDAFKGINPVAALRKEHEGFNRFDYFLDP